MNLLILAGILIALVKCFKASESTSKLTITVGDDVTFNAYLPEGFHDSEGFQGYFVELNQPDGCRKDLLIKGVQEGEVNDNNFVTYIDWYSNTSNTEHLCKYDVMVGHLKNISIHHFVLVVDRNANSGLITDKIKQISDLHFVMFDPVNREAFERFKSHVGTAKLKMIVVEPTKDDEQNTSIPMSSMAILFVTVAFVTLMTVSIGWLVFYYAQRCRQRNMRERLQSRLCVAAKRAVGKLPTKTVPDNPKNSKRTKKTSPSPDNDSTCSSCSSDDGDFCPVCLDLYKPREVVRILPCKHEFHKNCVDPWLFDHRTCPMCKLDILEHLGMPVPGERLNSPPIPPPEYSENVSTRVDQEVQTDFVNPPSPPAHISVAVRIVEDEIEPAPISPPSV